MLVRRLALLALIPLMAVTRYVDGNLVTNCVTNYSIDNRSCTGTDGAAFTTVQQGLSATGPSDTLDIRAGTYTTSGGYECCGTSGHTVTVGTASAPTRIIGHSGETVILASSGGQSLPALGATSDDTGTLVMWNQRGSGGGTPPGYFEISNLTINPGVGGAIVTGRAAHHFLLNNITTTNVSAYSPTLEGSDAGESTGLHMVFEANHFTIKNMTISNGGTVKVFNVFWGGVSGNGENDNTLIDGMVSNLSVSDWRGALERSGASGWVWQFIKARNYQPWTGDDGTFVKLYDGAPTTMRYVDVKETANSYSLSGIRWAAGHRNLNAGDGDPMLGHTQFSNWTYEDDDKVDDNWSILGIDEVGSGTDTNNDTRMYMNVFMNTYRAIWACWKDNVPSSTSLCSLFTFSHNAYSNVTVPVEADLTPTPSVCRYDTTTETGRVTSGVSLTSEHFPNAGSTTINAGRSDNYGDGRVFPPPIGGGATIDIGAWESGAGATWPYDFQSQKTVTKNPATQTIRLCWDIGATGCDYTFQSWDAYFFNTSARSSSPTWARLQVDPAVDFSSGNGATVANGMGPLYDSGEQNRGTNKFIDVPVGTLTNGQSYYVRLTEANANQYRAQDNTGFGAWSLPFYRFTVQSGAGPVCPDGIINGTEQCDGTGACGGSVLCGTATCNTATSGTLPNGTLRCSSSCTFDTSLCTASTPVTGQLSGVTGNGVTKR